MPKLIAALLAAASLPLAATPTRGEFAYADASREVQAARRTGGVWFATVWPVTGPGSIDIAVTERISGTAVSAAGQTSALLPASMAFSGYGRTEPHAFGSVGYGRSRAEVAFSLAEPAAYTLEGSWSMIGFASTAMGTVRIGLTGPGGTIFSAEHIHAAPQHGAVLQTGVLPAGEYMYQVFAQAEYSGSQSAPTRVSLELALTIPGPGSGAAAAPAGLALAAARRRRRLGS